MVEPCEMNAPDLAAGGFELADWTVQPALNRLSRGDAVVHLRPRVMDLLVYLAQRAGDVVPKCELIDALWGKEYLADTALTRAVFELREALGDDPHRPAFVATIPKRGYRLLAPVSPLHGQTSVRPDEEKAARPASVRAVVLSRTCVTALVLSFLGAVWHPGHHAAVAAPTPSRRVVVLPFENLGRAEDASLTAGLAEEITTRLASVSGVAVIARGSAEKLAGSGLGDRAIGEALAAEYVLTGTVRWDRAGARGDRVRITPKLIRVRDGAQVWATSYDETIRDVLRVQAAVATSVIAEIGVRLTGAARDGLTRPVTRSPEAYEAYLRGVHHGDNLYEPEEELRVGLQMFERAVQLDPGFTNAWASLSILRAGMYHMGHDRTPKCCEDARRAADEALRLEPDSAWSHMSLGYHLYWCQGDYPRALEEFARARHEHGESARTWAPEGYVLRRLGRWDDALQAFGRAAALDPLDPNQDREAGLTSLAMRRYEDAERHFRRAIGLAPDGAAQYEYLAQTYWQWRGDVESARATLAAIPRPTDPVLTYWWYWQELYEGRVREALERIESSSVGVVTNDVVTNGLTWDTRDLMLARAYSLLGRTAEARRSYEAARAQIDGLLQQRPGEFALHSAMGVALAGLGRGAEAIRSGRRAVELMPPSRDALDSIGPLLSLAEIKVAAGDHEGACHDLATLLSAAGGPSRPLLALDPRWAPLRSRPCYVALVSGQGR